MNCSLLRVSKMAVMEVTEEFKSLTAEEVEKLPVFPEPSETEDVDGGPGYVYLIRETNPPGAPQNFKVGQTVDLKKRLSDLQTGNQRPLSYLRYVQVNNTNYYERAAQGALHNYRCTLGGGTEWFTAQPNQVNTLVRIFNQSVQQLD